MVTVGAVVIVGEVMMIVEGSMRRRDWILISWGDS